MSTDPGAGAEVRRGTEVASTVSKGPERYAVPNVVGMSQAEATAQIERVNLAVGKRRQGVREKVPEGQVVAANPGRAPA